MAWIFKNAYAGEDLDVIADVFPDARFVMTHRDPVEQFGSITALGHKWRAFHSDVVTKAQTGREYLAFWGDFASRTVAACARVPKDRIIHVRYRDVVKAPMEEVRRIYDACGYALTPEAEGAIRAYDGANQQHRHGTHDYGLGEFGLTEGQVRAAYADYLDAFGAFI